MLADKLQLAGWMISRSGVSKIEGGLMYVPDFRLLYFAYIFQVDLPTLFPEVNLRSPIHETILRFVHIEQNGTSQPGAPELNKGF